MKLSKSTQRLTGAVIAHYHLYFLLMVFLAAGLFWFSHVAFFKNTELTYYSFANLQAHDSQLFISFDLSVEDRWALEALAAAQNLAWSGQTLELTVAPELAPALQVLDNLRVGLRSGAGSVRFSSQLTAAPEGSYPSFEFRNLAPQESLGYLELEAPTFLAPSLQKLSGYLAPNQAVFVFLLGDKLEFGWVGKVTDETGLKAALALFKDQDAADATGSGGLKNYSQSVINTVPVTTVTLPENKMIVTVGSIGQKLVAASSETAFEQITKVARQEKTSLGATLLFRENTRQLPSTGSLTLFLNLTQSLDWGRLDDTHIRPFLDLDLKNLAQYSGLPFLKTGALVVKDQKLEGMLKLN